MLACDLLGQYGQQIGVLVVLGVDFTRRILRLGIDDRFPVSSRIARLQSLLYLEHEGFTARNMVVGRRQKSGLHIQHVLNPGFSDLRALEVGQVALDRLIRIKLACVNQL